MMTAKENALHTLLHDGKAEYIAATDDFLKISFPPAKERPPMFESGKDWFGCEWEWDAPTGGHAPCVNKPPLFDDITEWKDYVQFPDLDSVDWEAAAAFWLKDYDPEKQVLRFFLESGPMERINAMMGFENSLISMATEPEAYLELAMALADYKIGLIERGIKYYHPDEIFVQDDLGTAKGPMMSIDMYRKTLKPAHKKIGEFINDNHLIYTHHSCGKIEPFIPELIDCGISVINPLQPINDWEFIKGRYLGKIGFWVGAETHANYTDAKEEDIRQDVRDIIDTFGDTKSLIFDAWISNTDCQDNRLIIMDEFRKYTSH